MFAKLTCRNTKLTKSTHNLVTFLFSHQKAGFNYSTQSRQDIPFLVMIYLSRQKQPNNEKRV